jgi:proline dehydrogenase
MPQNTPSQPHAVMDFYDTETAFKPVSTQALHQSAWLFKTMHYPWLVKSGQRIITWALALRLPIQWVVKKTVFNHFCGGESIEDSLPRAQALASHGIGTILDYSVEGAQNDAFFDHTVQEILHTLDAARQHPYRPFCVFKVTGIAQTSLLEKASSNIALNHEEKAAYHTLEKRIQTICSHAHALNVPVFIDAEESWIQPAIDTLCEQMMLRFNTQKAIVFTTLQMYRHDRLDYLQHLIDGSQKHGVHLGVKLVRGAYMEKERSRATSMGYASPIQTTKNNTDTDYNKALELCIQNLQRCVVCVATHNEQSVLHAIQEMKKRNIPHNHPHIHFAQLLGMSDHISYNLAHHTYHVAKYVPYGPVASVMPYLFRRAEENTSIQGQTGRELTLIQKELSRRAHT